MKNVSKFKNPLLFISTLLCLVFFLSACKNEDNVNKAIGWIEKHPKPIVVTLHTRNYLTLENRYTLRDSNNNIYNTGSVELSLPDTLK